MATLVQATTPPVTTKKLNIAEVARVVTRTKISQQNAKIRDLNNYSSNIQSELSEIMSYRRRIAENITSFTTNYLLLVEIQKTSPLKQNSIYRQYLKKTNAISSNLIATLSVENPAAIHFTTAMLTIKPDSYPIGKFWGRICLICNKIYLSNLTWRVQTREGDEGNWYDHPCIKRNEPCWGNWSNDISKLLQQKDIDILLDTILDFLMATNNSGGNPYFPWSKWRGERVRAKTLIEKYHKTVISPYFYCHCTPNNQYPYIDTIEIIKDNLKRILQANEKVRIIDPIILKILKPTGIRTLAPDQSENIFGIEI